MPLVWGFRQDREQLPHDLSAGIGEGNLDVHGLRQCDQTLRNYRLTTIPAEHRRQVTSGPYWVVTTNMTYKEPLRRLELASEFAREVTTQPDPGPGPRIAELTQAVLASRDLSSLGPAPYLFEPQIAVHEGAIANWAAQFVSADAGVVENARAIMSAVHRESAYIPGVTTARTPPVEAFSLRKGVCQDFAHIMTIALRAAGVPTAYASGYLNTRPPPGAAKLVGADAMHACLNVWCGEDHGWIGFDPTNDRLVQLDHIKIGMGRDYADVSPIDETFIGNVL